MMRQSPKPYDQRQGGVTPPRPRCRAVCTPTLRFVQSRRTLVLKIAQVANTDFSTFHGRYHPFVPPASGLQAARYFKLIAPQKMGV